MAIQAYYTWVSRGSPYTVCRPIRELVSLATAHGVVVLGVIGNQAHLTSNSPQDHTPFSRTPWPLGLPGYVVTACDLAAGDWCWTFLAECRSGLRPWVKYINFGGKQYSVKNDWQPVPNSDAHFHCSARTDQLDTAVGRDPWTPDIPPAQEEDDMKPVLFHKRSGSDTILYGLQTADRFVVTVEYAVAKRWAEQYGDSREISTSAFDDLARQYTNR